MITKFLTAQLAKEVGFKNVAVFYRYDEQGRSGLGGFVEHSGWRITPFDWNSYTKENYISAPLQSELQRWLRDEQKIHIKIGNDPITGWYAIITGLVGSKLKFENAEVYYPTYEECLEKAMIKVLQTIKNKV